MCTFPYRLHNSLPPLRLTHRELRPRVHLSFTQPTGPGWGEHVYSRSVDDFKPSAAPRPFRTLNYQALPVVMDFEDRPNYSLLLQRPKKDNASTANNYIRFAAFTSMQTRTRPSRGPLFSPWTLSLRNSGNPSPSNNQPIPLIGQWSLPLSTPSPWLSTRSSWMWSFVQQSNCP